MKRIKELSLQGPMLLFASVFCLLQLGISPQASAQTTGPHDLQSNVVAGLGCAPSNNGTGHMNCTEMLANPTAGDTPLLGGVSWQVPGNPNMVGPDPNNNGAVTEVSGRVDQITNIDLPNGPFTGTPSCAKTNDDSGTAICAVEGTNNGLYGIAIHPAPLASMQTVAQATSPLVPLLMPGQVLSFGVFPDGLTPCTTANPCNRVGAIASNPSCAATEGRMVICAVNVLLQNTVGAANTTLVGLAFDPRLALAPPTGTTQGINPSIIILQNGTNVTSDPSCTDDVNPTVNGGFGFAACAWVFQDNFFGATATLFGASFDPRAHGGNRPYNPGALTVSASSINGPGPMNFPTNGDLVFNGDPSCATPRDAPNTGHSLGEITCAIGVGVGNGASSGTDTALLGVTFNPVTRTTATLNLGLAPSGTWSGVSCASPNDNLITFPHDTGNSVACVATTGTTNPTTNLTTNSTTMYAINFDPRTGLDPTTNAAPAWSSFTFSDPNTNATPTSLPSCVSENVINNQISCGIVDSAGNSVGFYTNPH
jgi:hypothetical protein